MSSDSGDRKKPVEDKLEHDGSKRKKKAATRSSVGEPPKRLIKSAKAKSSAECRSSAKAAKKKSALDRSAGVLEETKVDEEKGDEVKHDEISEYTATQSLFGLSDKNWVAADDMVNMLTWAKEHAVVSGGFDQMAAAFVEAMRPELAYCPTEADVKWYRDSWNQLRSEMKFHEALALFSSILLNQKLYWNRVKVAARTKPWFEVKPLVDFLLDARRLNVPTIFKFLHGEMFGCLETVLRYIVRKDNNGDAMRSRNELGEVLNAQEFFTWLGDEEKADLFTEYYADRGLSPTAVTGQLERDVQRHFFDQLQAVRSHSIMNAKQGRELVKLVTDLWKKGIPVVNVLYQTAKLFKPNLGKVLVSLIIKGKFSSRAVLRQLHSLPGAIVDPLIFEAVVAHFKAEGVKKVATLKLAIEKMLTEPSELRAFQQLCAIEDYSANGDAKPHGVHMWKGTAVAESVKPVPHKSEEALRESVVVMKTDGRIPVLCACDEMHAERQAVDSRFVNPEFERIMKAAFSGSEALSRGTILFAKVKGIARAKIKAAEYRAEGRKFPQAACILDTMRCSICFDTCEELFAASNALDAWFHGLSPFDELKPINVALVRRKNTVKHAMERGVGDLKYNPSITVKTEDGFVTSIGEVQLQLKTLFEANFAKHTDYEILRLEDYKRRLAKACIGPKRFHSLEQIETVDEMATIGHYLNCLVPKAERIATVCRWLRIHDLTPTAARVLLKFIPATVSPFPNNNALTLFVETHCPKPNFDEFLRIIDERLAGEQWKSRKDDRGKTALQRYLARGHWNEACVKALIPSGDGLATAELFTDNNHLTVAHSVARRAVEVGPTAVSDFKRLFPCYETLLANGLNRNGPPVVVYLNNGGRDPAVARSLAPKEISARKKMGTVLLTLDLNPSTFGIVKDVFGEELLKEFAESVDGKTMFCAAHLYAIRNLFGDGRLDCEIVKAIAVPKTFARKHPGLKQLCPTFVDALKACL